MSVREAFSKLAGVSSVEIEPGEDPGTQKVTVKSTSAELTKEQAIASLGDKAARYVVQTWKKADE